MRTDDAHVGQIGDGHVVVAGLEIEGHGVRNHHGLDDAKPASTEHHDLGLALCSGSHWGSDPLAARWCRATICPKRAAR